MVRRVAPLVSVAAMSALVALAGCTAGDASVRGQVVGPVTGVEQLTTTTTTTTTASPTPNGPGCVPLGPAVTTGTMADPSLTEASGLALGVRSPGVLFTHNDSGDTARVVAMTMDGRPLGSFVLAGADAIDWEDMAVGPGPDPGASYLYLGDIGDNPGTRSGITVYRAPEPAVRSDAGEPASGTLDEVTRFDLTYPDGIARDAESLLVDPDTGEVVVVAKTFAPRAESFRFRPGPEGGSVSLEAAGEVTVTGLGLQMLTGGSVSADGTWVALRTYDRVLRFPKEPGATITEALAGVPCVDALPLQPQGEAVALSPTGDAVVTTSEGPAAAIQTQEVGGG
jgi:hypothetical protein